MIVVTGADGVVGRAVCNRLNANGAPFIPVVRQRREFTAVGAYVMDLSHNDGLAALQESNISGIIHLAAAVPHSSYYPDNEQSAALTRAMDGNVLSFCKCLEIPVIYMSTCGLYDRANSAIKYENDDSQIKIESPYFAAKRDGEKMFSSESPAVILRLAAPVGPGLSAGLVVSRFLSAARADASIRIWGSGAREQAFVDVRDVADLVCSAIVEPRAGVFNVAGNKPTTMVELAETVLGVVGKGSIEYSDRSDPREGETARYSITKVYEAYGWKPRRGLADSCKSIIEEDFGVTV